MLTLTHRKLLSDDPRFEVPTVIPELSTKRVLTTDLVHGMPLDQCASLPQDTKNDVRHVSLDHMTSHDHYLPSHYCQLQIAERILSLCLRELFEFHLMQTDPNWSNFFYNEEDKKVSYTSHIVSCPYPIQEETIW